jgi:transcriptional regulator with XRE-family HTH domain
VNEGEEKGDSQQVEQQGKTGQSRQFAKLLNHLFQTHLTDSGRPYTLSEVSQGTGMTVPYLSILRKGNIGAVPFDRVEMLARFFRVPLDYFSQEGPPLDTLDDEMRHTLSKPLVREVALRAGGMGMAERALILQMMEHAEKVLGEAKRTDGLEREGSHE